MDQKYGESRQLRTDFRNSEGVTMNLEDVDKEDNSGPRFSTGSTAGSVYPKDLLKKFYVLL